jgi:iron(III) transport system substrate-binding protein
MKAVMTNHTRRAFLRQSASALSLLAAGAALPACGRRGASAREAMAYTSVDLVFAEPIFRDFERASGTRIRAVFDTEETKSTGVVNRLVAEGKNPQADVFWSGDPVRIFSLIKRGLVEPYLSPNAASIPPSFRAADGAWTGLAARARVLLVSTRKAPGAERPSSVRDLAAVRWRGQTAMANPLFGTTTMHVASLFAAWGDEQAKRFLDELKGNGVRIASSNGEVKRLVASGEVAFGLTDTDDAHEAIQGRAPVEVVYPDQDGMGTLVMPTAVVLMRGGPHPEAARKLIDYLLSAEVEKQLTENGAHMPLRADVPAPPGVRRASELKAMQVDYARVADEMERIQPWLRRWAGL